MPSNLTLSPVLKLCAAEVVITAGEACVIPDTVAWVPCSVIEAEAVT